jgi:FMN phosphatase YigB (HAD superfamily)
MLRAIRSPDGVLALVRRRKPDVVSFDLFDTLVYRTVIKPKDVFLIQGRRLRRAGLIDLPAPQWLAQRKRAEHQLIRSLAPGEVTLEQIYDALLAAGELSSREARDAALRLELDLEREVIRLFDFVPEMLAVVKNTGARVVVLSDIYLPQAFIRELLEPVARWIDDVHCSSHTQRTKRHGQAYALLKTGGKALHFGDNARSDRLRAWQNGIDGRLISWERQRWLRRNRAAVSLLRLCGSEMPPLADPGNPPAPDSLEDLAVRWSIVLYDFLLDLRRQAHRVGATDLWLSSRDTESLWAVLRQCPDFFGSIAVRYVRVSRKATYTLMARADPTRFARWQGRWFMPAEPGTAELAERYYRGLLRPETRHVLLVDLVSGGRGREAVRLALPPSVSLTGFYFSMLPHHEAAGGSRMYLPWRYDLLEGCPIEMLSAFSEGTLLAFRDTDEGGVEPVLQPDPKDAAPTAYLESLRAALKRLVEADAEAGEREEPDTARLMKARLRVVRPLMMFPSRGVARSVRGWLYCSPQFHPAHDVVHPRDNRIRRLLAIASGDNRWPSIALHSVAPAWLVPALQWLAVGRLKIKNRRDRIEPLHKQTALLVGHDDRG